MRRLMLGMSQTNLADALGLTFQQVQKYESGTNRVGASRLHHLSEILQVPVSFFFGDLAQRPGETSSDDTVPVYVDEFVTSAEGLALIKAFSGIKNARLRQSVVRLVEQIASASS